MALTNLMLELSGPDASLYQIFARSAFPRIAGDARERRARRSCRARQAANLWSGCACALDEANDQNDEVTQAAQAQQKQKNSIAAAAEIFAAAAPRALLGPRSGFPQSPQRQACHMKYDPSPIMAGSGSI